MSEAQLLNVPIANLRPSPVKIRDVYLDKPEFTSLKRSIIARGIEQPLTCRPHRNELNQIVPNIYEICDGWHRFNAAKQAFEAGAKHLANIPCKVREMSNEEVQTLQFMLNHHRVKTNARDMRDHLVKWASAHPEKTQGDIAEDFAITAAEVSNIMGLRNLTDENAELVGQGIVNSTKAVQWAKMPQHLQDEYREQAISMPVQEFLALSSSVISAYKKSGRVDKHNIIVYHPLTRAELIERYENKKAIVQATPPDDASYPLLVARFNELEEILQVDAATLAAKKAKAEQERLIKEQVKNAKKLAEAEEILKKHNQKLVTEVASAQPLAV